MTSAGSMHGTAYEADYQAVLARAGSTVAGFPPALRSVAEPMLPQWGEASFSRIVALLPYWIADLLDRSPPRDAGPPIPHPGDTETLALANLLGWWSYLIQDELIDGDLDPGEFLPLSMALHASAVSQLAQLLPGDRAFWGTFECLSLASSEASAWEQRLRLDYLKDRTTIDPDLVDPDRLADRSALLQLAVVAQFALRGLDREHPLYAALGEMLRHYAIARQIADDRSDWVQDLQNGQVNFVSVRILRRMLEIGAIESLAELDVERMVGYTLYDEALFAGIQQEAIDACRRAAQCIAPYRSRLLDSLVSDLAHDLERNHQVARKSRRQVQAVFALHGKGSVQDLRSL
ncbi:MAG: hypothetical protein ACK2UA_12430 [Anaerolineae bacterium]